MNKRIAQVLTLLALTLGVGMAAAQVTLTTDQSCYEPGEEVAFTIHNGGDQDISVGDGIRIETQGGVFVWEPLCTHDGIFVLAPGESLGLDTSWDQTDHGPGPGPGPGCSYDGAQQVANGCYRALKVYTGSTGGIAVVGADFGIVDCPCPAATTPSTLEGPETVFADPFGQFSYEAVFTAGSGGAGLSFATAFGGENTDYAEWIADGECLFPFEEGHQSLETLSGALIDPSLPGSVTLRYALCAGEDLVLVTTILPSAVPIPAASTWGVVLLALGLLIAGAIVFFRRS